ncbi:FCS-Like zinc finger 6-like protein [Tanacetum coccineum]
MILGKRPRPPIKRTTSMTEFTLELNHTGVVAGGGGGLEIINSQQQQQQQQPTYDPFKTNQPTVSPRNHRRNSADYMEENHFLTACHFCKRRLITGRDIFMYRGDSAFCSFECRQQQISQDEKKNKHSLAPKKPDSNHSRSFNKRF